MIHVEDPAAHCRMARETIIIIIYTVDHDRNENRAREAGRCAYLPHPKAASVFSSLCRPGEADNTDIITEPIGQSHREYDMIISHHSISSYHIISYHIISYRTISYHIIPYHIIPYHIIPYHIIPYHVTPYHIISYHIIPCE